MLPEELINIIAEYSSEYFLSEWAYFKIRRINWDFLCLNKNAETPKGLVACDFLLMF